MQFINTTLRSARSLVRGLALPALALAAAMPVAAQNNAAPALGRGTDCSPASATLSTPMAQVQPIHDGPLTRSEVIEELKSAKASGRMALSGEIGDSAQVLAARETFNALQSEVYDTQLATAQSQQLAVAACRAANPPA